MAHEYTVRIDPELERLRVIAQFDPPVNNIRARSHDATDFLLAARRCGEERSLRPRGRRLQLPAGGIDCLAYVVDLEAAARAERRNSALADDNIIVSTAAWLWRPSLRDGNDIRVRFETADSIDVALPWQPAHDDPNTWLLSRSPESANALAVFGDFDYREVQIPGATLRIAVLQSDAGVETDAIVDWVTGAAGHIGLAYGRFPNPNPTVVVIPIGRRWWSNSAVPFGRVIRDGGETVELFVNESRPMRDFYSSWTATHEFSHLMTPYISSRHRWVSEGLAQYYQNLLLARAGVYSERRAWQELYEGLERGRRSAPQLSPNEAARYRSRGTTMKIYWTGAAIALLGDVELRARSNGRESLDLLLDRLDRCCLPSDRTWTGPEFYQRLDAMLDEPVFMPLYRRYANTDGFPDVLPLLRQLGVDVRGGRVILDDAAELAAIRRALTTRPDG